MLSTMFPVIHVSPSERYISTSLTVGFAVAEPGSLYFRYQPLIIRYAHMTDVVIFVVVLRIIQQARNQYNSGDA